MTHFNYFYERFFVGISVPVSAVIYCSSYSYLVFHALILIFCSFRSFSPSHTHSHIASAHTRREDKKQCRNLCILCLLIINSM